jgi:hypothetical protein
VQLYVDDIRSAPNDDWVVARSYRDAVKYLESGVVTSLSLDHDLGGKLTGYDICVWMVSQEYFVWPITIVLHTSNTVGRDNMRQLLTHYKPRTTAVVG